jgi:hypothetical protein
MKAFGLGGYSIGKIRYLVIVNQLRWRGGNNVVYSGFRFGKRDLLESLVS